MHLSKNTRNKNRQSNRRANNKTLLRAACIISLLAQSALAAPDAFQSAIALYNKKDYKSCTPILENYLRANPTNKVAYCYLANSYFALGQYDQAKKIAEYVIVNFTMTPESASCGELIARIQARTQAAKPTTGTRQSTDSNQFGQAINSAKQAYGGSAGFNIDSFVYTVRGSLAAGDVSPDFLKKVKAIVAAMPENVMARLQASGCKVCVTPRMADKLPGYSYAKPRGWDEGMSGKHVDGLFNGEVIICEHSVSYSDDAEYIKNQRYAGVLRHEMGHAVDWYFGRLSETEELKHSYLLELARVDVDAKEKDIAYYAQKSDAGRSECFAELFGAMTGGGCSKFDSMLQTSFSNTAKLIKAKVGLP